MDEETEGSGNDKREQTIAKYTDALEERTTRMRGKRRAYIFPPSNCPFTVITAAPAQMRTNTNVNTSDTLPELACKERILAHKEREERGYMARAKHKNIGPHKSPKCEKYRNEQEGRTYNHGDSLMFPLHSF